MWLSRNYLQIAQLVLKENVPHEITKSESSDEIPETSNFIILNDKGKKFNFIKSLGRLPASNH
jgi:hypothetical protein